MNDKRTLLGFLIIGIIFLLSPYYYEWMGLTPKPELPVAEESERLEKDKGQVFDPSPERQSPEGVSPSSSSKLLANSESAGTIQSRETPSATLADGGTVDEFTPRQIEVQTPLFRLIFSNRGGSLISCELKNFDLVDGSPVQLLSPRSEGLTLSLRKLDESQDLSRIEFSADRDLIQLYEGQATLKLSALLGQGLRIDKIFTFYADRHAFGLDIEYNGFDEDTEAFISWHGGIPFTEKDPDIDLPEMGALASFNDERVEIKVDQDESDSWTDKGALHWVGVRSKYFLSALIPADQKGRFRGVISGDYKGTSPVPNYKYEVGRRLSASGSWKNVVYLGPLDYDNLIRYSVGLEQAIDFGFPIIRHVAKLILIIFKAAHSYIPNYGWIIVLFAVVIKIIVYPLTHKTYESASKMQTLQPKIAALKEKYKNDNQRLSKETMKLYKEEGVNPLGGCLPMLLQMPIFISLYTIFSKTIELRQEPFALWITDLSTPDEIIFAGFPLHILPLLMALSMLVQQKMTMKDPKQAFLIYAMPVFMIFIFWEMSSGLVLYWTLFNVFTIIQQLLVNHYKAKSAATAS